MYDYIEIYGDKNHSKLLQIEDFQELFLNRPDIKKSSHVSFVWEIGEFGIRIQGILCDKNGDYCFNDDTHFKQVNLIEFNLPQNSESIYEDEIRTLVSEIAQKINWEINWRE